MKAKSHAARLFPIAALSILILSCASVPTYLAFEEPDDFHAAFPLPKELYEKENINGAFPETIAIKTRTQSFNSLHYYILRDGLIWYKGLSRATGPTRWTLFMKTGLPQNRKRDDFYEPRRIVEISADADELAALSDEGWFYRIVFDKRLLKKDIAWEDLHGWPTQSPLRLNAAISANRGWAIGKRNESVRYYEDVFGNQHHYGTAGILTNYLLMDDGQEIRFADPGLPSDFSRTLIGPERGAFISESIAASASTIFLIGAAGEMYTRLADFDTIGSDPMFFRYTYKPYVSDIPGTKYDSIMEPWGLPSEDWLSQPRIPLTGSAAISKRISIVQDGMGNGARELRVAGRDPDGEPGYWSKPIFGKSWSFVPRPLLIYDDELLHPALFADGKGPRGPVADRAYSGYLWNGSQPVPGIRFVIPDFNILEGPCRLSIYEGKNTYSLVFHPVEAWTYIKRSRPGRDGSPKLYLATIEIPNGALAAMPAKRRAELDQSILSGDREPFSYFMEATTEYLLIQPRDKQKSGYVLYLTPSGDGTYDPKTFRATQITELAKADRFAIEEDSPQDIGPFVRADLDGLKKTIREDEKSANEISERINAFTASQRKATISRFAYSALNLVSHVTLLYRNRYVYTITRHGGALLAINNDQLDLIAGTQIWLDGLTLELVKIRIDAYSKAAESLEEGAALAYLPIGYEKDYRGYMRAVRLPDSLDGRVKTGLEAERLQESASDGTIPARLSPVPIEKDFPGWILEVGKEPSFTLLVELEDAARKIYARGRASPSKKPLRLRARLHLVSTGSHERDKDLYQKTIGNASVSDRGIPAKVRWDGSELTISRATDASTEILFRGLLPRALP